MYFDIQCSTNVELSVLQQNQLTLSVEGWKLVEIKLKVGWYKVETLNDLWTHSQYKLTVDIGWNVEWLVNPQPIQVDSWYKVETLNGLWTHSQYKLTVDIFGCHSCRCVNCHHLCTHGDIFVFSVVLLFVYIYIVYSYIKLWPNSPIPSLHIC